MAVVSLIDFLFLLSGIYLIYTAIVAKKRGAIAVNVMLSKNVNVNDIKDRVGYIEYMYKKILLAGLMICAASVIHLANDYYIRSQMLTWVGIALIFAALAIYTVAFSRGQKKYISHRSGQSGHNKQK